MKYFNWNPRHGCHKLSPGCAHCYVYRGDAKRGAGDSSIVRKTSMFSLPVSRDRHGDYKIKSGDFVWTCFTSDFLVADADGWRDEAWAMIRERSDVDFMFITKRIDRFAECVPADWGEGYPNVRVCCTAEDQMRADYRLPIFRDAPIVHKSIVCEPLLERIDLSPYLGDWVRQVVAGGESGPDARVCDYDWILDIRYQCVKAHVPFWFKQTGAHFLKDGRLYSIERRLQHAQARKAGISTYK